MESNNYRSLNYLDSSMFEKFIASGASRLEENVKKINDLNVFPIPDGDTGDNMYRTIVGGIESMKSEDSLHLGKKATALASGMLFNARGNSGVILSQLFYGLSLGFNDLEKASINDIVIAFEEAVKRAYASVRPPVEGTILTVAREAIEKTKDEINGINTIGEFSDTFIHHMYDSLENTPNLLKVLEEAGVIDSGGAGLYLICEGVCDCISGKSEDIELSFHNENKNINLDFSKFTEDSELVFGYCTELLLRLMNKKVNVKEFDEQIIIDYLNTIGDSIVCFKQDSIIKIHVHTMHPQLVLDFCQNYGEFLTVKIENMTLQHNESRFSESSLPIAKKSRSKFATIVVCDGEGICNLFKDLGVSYIIDGGQGKNPSIIDFVNAYKEVNADNIYVYPNNSNIILAANQSKDIYNESNIYVMESKNIGQAYTSLSMLDYSLDTGEELFDLLNENLNQSNTSLICKAIRPVTLNGINVSKDDYISISDKKIVASSSDINQTIISTLREFDFELLTIFYGKTIDKEKQKEIKSKITSNFPDIELYDMDGGQNTFDLILIME